LLNRPRRPVSRGFGPAGYPADARQLADIQDRDGGALLLSTLFGMYPFLAKLFADAGYQGPQFAEACGRDCEKVAASQRLRRAADALGVERTLAWLNRCRRLAKDFENLTDNALAFQRLASIRLMLRRLCNPS
jgi:transposase